jgi:uncharacterized membrane protein
VKGWLWMALGLLALVLGAVWTLQGLNVLGGSVMSGVTIWAIVGPVVAFVGLILVIVGITVRGRAKRLQPHSRAADQPAGDR